MIGEELEPRHGGRGVVPEECVHPLHGRRVLLVEEHPRQRLELGAHQRRDAAVVRRLERGERAPGVGTDVGERSARVRAASGVLFLGTPLGLARRARLAANTSSSLGPASTTGAVTATGAGSSGGAAGRRNTTALTAPAIGSTARRTSDQRTGGRTSSLPGIGGSPHGRHAAHIRLPRSGPVLDGPMSPDFAAASLTRRIVDGLHEMRTPS